MKGSGSMAREKGDNPCRRTAQDRSAPYIQSFPFAHQTTGLLVINGDDENTLDAVKDVEIEKITYGFGENCDYRAENISADKGVHEQFDLYFKGEKLTQIKLIVPGKHNIYNALAAAATAHYLGATPKEISENLHKFGGVHRRFEILGTPDGITVADDFAHHPTELTATLNAAMKMCNCGPAFASDDLARFICVCFTNR